MKNFEKLKIKKKWLIPLLTLTASFVLVISFQNCSAVSSPYGSDTYSSSLSEADVSSQKAMAILTNKCSSCHNPSNPSGDISEITNINYLLYYRLVIPGQPEISDLIKVIKDGSMPPSGSLSNDDLAALTDWIQTGLIDTETGGVIGDSAGLQPTFASLSVGLFNTRCVGCHNAGNRSGNTDLSTYAGVKASVNANRLVASVERTGGNFMPSGGSRLTTDEINTMKMWIANGANND